MQELQINTKQIGKEVVVSIEEWAKLIMYIDDLKKANQLLNKEIEAYNKEINNAN